MTSNINWLKVGSIFVSIVLFSSLFVLSLKVRTRELPKIRFCCNNETFCEEAGTKISAMNINHKFDHKTEYSVIKKEPACDEVMGFNDRPDFYITKDGNLASSDRKDETYVCNFNQFCLELKDSEFIAQVCNEEDCRVEPKLSIFWNVNFIAIPCILALIFSYVFIGKSKGKLSKLLMCYVIHLVVLHICLAIAKLAHQKLVAMPIPCGILSYLSYYCLIASCSWLCVMCQRFRQSLSSFRGSFVNDDAGNKHASKKKSVLFYIIAVLVISVIATLAIGVSDIFYKPKGSYYCVRLQYDSVNFAFAPILAVLIYGIVLFSQTRVELQQILHETSEGSDQVKLYWVHLRLYLVMTTSWICYILIEPLKFHVVTMMNALHILALLLTFNDFVRPRDLMSRISLQRDKAMDKTTSANVEEIIEETKPASMPASVV